MTDSPNVKAMCFCNVVAKQRGLDPAGSAGSFADTVVIETPLPWGVNIYEQAGKLPQEAINLLQLWLKRYYEGTPYDHLMLMIAPDTEYSCRGFRRVIYYERPTTPFAQYDKVEYLVPEAQLGALVWALCEAKNDLPNFDAYRQDNADVMRDLMVCTHGSVDPACAKFGYPLYRQLRRHHASENLRVWRVSHFGGHVFAPTLMDMPHGHLWAYVGEAEASQIATRSGSVKALHGHYRGWMSLDSGVLQAAEGAAWQRAGWQWFDYPKQATILAQGDEWSAVRIEFRTPSGTGVYEARVERCNIVETEHSTNNEDRYPYPQYRVTELKRRR